MYQVDIFNNAQKRHIKHLISSNFKYCPICRQPLGPYLDIKGINPDADEILTQIWDEHDRFIVGDILFCNQCSTQFFFKLMFVRDGDGFFSRLEISIDFDDVTRKQRYMEAIELIWPTFVIEASRKFSNKLVE